MPRPAEHKLVTQTAGRMSKGRMQPKLLRTAATLVGSSWMDAVFKTMSLHSSLVAMPFLPEANRWAARIPIGVAALPKPRRLAHTLALR